MTSVYPNGIPDLLAIGGGQAFFIEMKRPGGRLSEIQKVIHRRLAEKGFIVRVWSTKQEVEEFMDYDTRSELDLPW